MEKRLTALLSVKSLVTIILTAVFAYLSVAGQINKLVRFLIARFY